MQSTIPSTMYKPSHLVLAFPAFLLLLLFDPSHADVGTASFYGAPFLPTVCYGNDASQFPAFGMFAAAGDGIWDNGASCGREYAVRCLSSAMPGACIVGQTIQVKIVDRASMLNSMPSKNGTTLVLSATAFQAIANRSSRAVNIEFSQ